MDALGLPALSGSPVPAGTFPVGIVIDRTGRFVYVANANSDDVSLIHCDPTTALLVRIGETAVSTGCAPQELAIDRSLTFLFVSCSGSSADSIAQFAISPATRVLDRCAAHVLDWIEHDAQGDCC